MSQQLCLSGKAVTQKYKATEPPSPQAVVSTHVPTLFRKFVTINNPKVVGGKEVKKFIVLKCPNGNCKLDQGEYEHTLGTGWTNPFKHLVTCVGKGSVDAVHDHYYNTLASAKKESLLCNYGIGIIAPEIPVTRRDLEIHDIIELIVMKYCPLNISESEDPLMHKKWFHHDNNFSAKTVCNVLLATCTEVEKEIAAEMKE